MRLPSILTIGLVSALACNPAAAQQSDAPKPQETSEDSSAEAGEQNSDLSQEPEEGALVINLLAPSPPVDEYTEEDARRCEVERDVARIAGEIIVCRQRAEEDASGFDKSDWERRYAQRTQGVSPPDVEGAGGRTIYRHLGSVFMVTVTTKLGEAKEQPIFIDVEALPEAPPGSDANRAAQGLPPLERED